MNLFEYAEKPDEVVTIRIARKPYYDPEESVWRFSPDPEVNHHSLIYHVGRMKTESNRARPTSHLPHKQRLISALREFRRWEERFGDMPELAEIIGAAEKTRCINEV